MTREVHKTSFDGTKRPMSLHETCLLRLHILSTCILLEDSMWNGQFAWFETARGRNSKDFLKSNLSSLFRFISPCDIFTTLKFVLRLLFVSFLVNELSENLVDDTLRLAWLKNLEDALLLGAAAFYLTREASLASKQCRSSLSTASTYQWDFAELKGMAGSIYHW